METYNNPEIRPKYGANVTIRNFWQRHSQKQSGEVFNAQQTGLSTSSISEVGVKRAENLGALIKPSLHGAKGYISKSPRTLETFDAMMSGYKSDGSNVPVREAVRFKQGLVAAEGNKEFLQTYNKKWEGNKQALLAQGIIDGRYPNADFSTLTPDQQEEIAEAAEEPVIREWTDIADSELAKIYPPRLQAAKFAKLFNDRHERMAGKLATGSEVDLFHVTHKSATEPFLASGVLIRKSDGQRITQLEQIGGSLQILGNWESEVKIDSQGKASTTVKIRDEEFLVDEDELQKLLSIKE